MPVTTSRLSALTLLLTLFVAAPTSAAPVSAASCQRIASGPGPDDMAIQPLTTPRLLISSHDRRRFVRSGDIYAYTPSGNQMIVMTRSGEPEGFRLRPHGMDLVQRDGRWWLYVISHDRELFSDQHSLMIYEVVGDNLRFHQQLTSPLLGSPNDVAVADNGDIYVTNERIDGASIVELVFLQRKANVVVYRPGAGWRVAATELAFSNGIYIQGATVWIAQTLGEGLTRFTRRSDGTLGQRDQIGTLSLLDGLSPGRPGTFLVPAYPNLLSLGWHWQRQTGTSRSLVYEVNRDSGEGSLIFQDDGNIISAVSSAVLLDDRLYLGQLFNSYILSCPWPR